MQSACLKGATFGQEPDYSITSSARADVKELFELMRDKKISRSGTGRLSLTLNCHFPVERENFERI